MPSKRTYCPFCGSDKTLLDARAAVKDCAMLLRRLARKAKDHETKVEVNAFLERIRERGNPLR